MMSASKWIVFVCLITCFLKCSGSEAKPGDNFNVQCQGPRDADSDTVMLKWIRPDLKSEGYVFYFRNNQTQKDYQHPSFLGRVELRDPQMKDGHVSVILKNVNVNDTGTYECYVGIKGSKPQLISTTKLTVRDSEINAKPGENVTLQCQGPRDADSDTVILRWIRPDLKSEGSVYLFKDNQIQKDLQHPSFDGRVELRDPQMKDGDVSVILKNVNINDTGTYECYVGNKGSKPQLLNTTNLIIKDSGDAAGHSEDGGDKGKQGRLRVGLLVGIAFLVVVVFGVRFKMYRRSSQQNHQPPADEAAEHELQDLNPEPSKKLKEEEEEPPVET
ncbi:V-set domain-containing T-cell activation inhibitor 1 Precursor [Channa argus]|uniref:V-set domain-containing T-cell activation inhibitor 1 n=1 Tax=Channa argus TaxID=215402 RepID=A0A6G1Q6W7_CHAAH|nr:V-set domain-containing T-cell activation inhibitor 1 Precursor [Channa argus]